MKYSDLGFSLFVYFFLLLYLLNNGHNIKSKWVIAAKGEVGEEEELQKGSQPITFQIKEI